MKRHAQEMPELWGGFECSIVRVADAYRNQIAETGHLHRLADLDAAASLGIRKMRYPLLWEAIAPEHPDACRWEWADERVAHLQRLGIGVIAGLCHHGSGPHYTHLLDENFPNLLARHAARVSERYPSITDFTPINEPLTTARFSCLYGHWYPHERSEKTFLKALFIQIQAVRLAMQAVRKINPQARLIQTEDLGRVFGPASLAGQVDYENERRWLSFDLLAGRVDRQHGFYKRFLDSGVNEHELGALVDAPCIPDVIGINHYLTSDRYLDDQLEGYPTEFVGGNGVQTYTDVAAVRVPGLEGQTGFAARLREAWQRYGQPLALTEVHNGSTREEQVRWLAETWQSAVALSKEGIPIEGFAVWALVGAIDWTSLLTERRGEYESGVFDIRSGRPRPTALATFLRDIRQRTSHPVLEGQGWWKRETRFHRLPAQPSPAILAAHRRRPILITGKRGTLGRAFARICDARDLYHVTLGRETLDIADPCQLEEALQIYQPWAVINAAGFVRVADASHNSGQCMRDNSTGAKVLAAATCARKIPLVTFSSDLVFDGTAGRPYTEDDETSPRCVYGHSKVQAELSVLAAHPGALVVRTSAFFGPWDRYNFAWSVLAALADGQVVHADSKVVVTPTYVPDLVNATLDLLIDETTGLWHLTNGSSVSWLDFARLIAVEAGADAERVVARGAGPASNTSLATLKGAHLPPLARGLSAFAEALR